MPRPLRRFLIFRGTRCIRPAMPRRFCPTSAWTRRARIPRPGRARRVCATFCPTGSLNRQKTTPSGSRLQRLPGLLQKKRTSDFSVAATPLTLPPETATARSGQCFLLVQMEMLLFSKDSTIPERLLSEKYGLTDMCTINLGFLKQQSLLLLIAATTVARRRAAHRLPRCKPIRSTFLNFVSPASGWSCCSTAFRGSSGPIFRQRATAPAPPRLT